MLIIIFSFLLSFVAQGDDCHHTPTRFNCVKYLNNYDGDTVTFNIPNTHPLIGEKISVRLYGLDTPEIKTKITCEKEKGRIAKKLVESLLSRAKRIDLINLKRDKYFRILADIQYDGISLKNILLKNDLAYEYFGETKQKVDWCKKARSLAGSPADR